MRAIITGGTGLIGSALTASLLHDGHDVIILSRNPDAHHDDTLSGAELVAWDAKTANGWGDLINEVDAVVNLAATSISGNTFPPKRWTPERKQLIVDSRIDTGKAVTEAIRQATHKPAVLIQASAIGYYGPHGDEIVLESTAPGSNFLAGVTMPWEQSTQPVEGMGVRRVVTRIGVVFSDKGGAFPILVLPFRLFVGGRLGSGEQYVSWIHIEDVVRAMHFLIEREQTHPVYNLTAPHPVTNAALAKVIGKAMGRPAYFPVPAPVLRLALGEVATTVLEGQRVVPENLRADGFEFEYREPEQAVKDLLSRMGLI